jgi:hypothetical protein
MRYSLLFVALVLLLAVLLPTGHTLGLLGSSRVLWDEFLGLIRDPLLQLLRLLGRTSAPVHPTQIPPNLHLPPPPHLPRPHPAVPSPRRHGATVNWGAIIQSLLFWAVVAACAFYLVRSYVQRRPRLARTAGASTAVLAALSRLWSVVQDWLRRSRDALIERMPRRLMPGADVSVGVMSLPFARRGHLSPRDQVVQSYLRMVRRAEREGVARQPSQTPHEFEPVLITRLPEAGSAVHDLTDAFIQARYSPHEVGDDTAGRAQISWQKIRSAWRKVRL